MKIPLWDNTSLNAVEQRIIFNGGIPDRKSKRGVEKLTTIKTIFIKKLKSQLNTRDEYQWRELTLKN